MLAIDEFAIQRVHRHATAVLDPTRKRVLWIARGRDQGALTEFFHALGPTRCAQLEAVAVDMWAPYAAEVRAHCPQAQLIYDLFHVVAKYGPEVIDRVRVDETNRVASAAGPGPIRNLRHVIKGARWLLLRNREHLTSQTDRIRLRELLRVNRALFIVYELKDDLKQLWRFRYPRGTPILESVAPPRTRESHPRAADLCADPRATPRRHHWSLTLSPQHRHARRDQQQDPSHQAHGLRLPR